MEMASSSSRRKKKGNVNQLSVVDIFRLIKGEAIDYGTISDTGPDHDMMAVRTTMMMTVAKSGDMGGAVEVTEQDDDNEDIGRRRRARKDFKILEVVSNYGTLPPQGEYAYSWIPRSGNRESYTLETVFNPEKVDGVYRNHPRPTREVTNAKGSIGEFFHIFITMEMLTDIVSYTNNKIQEYLRQHQQINESGKATFTKETTEDEIRAFFFGLMYFAASWAKI